MKRITNSILLHLLLPILFFDLSSAASSTTFITTSCSTTTYPNVCMQTLSSFGPTVLRSPRKLAHTALTVSADRAREASVYVSRLSSSSSSGRKSVQSGQAAGALLDCMKAMDGCSKKLQRSVEEMGRLGRAGSARYGLHLSNVLTWVSAALTDQNMCLDGLAMDGRGGAREMVRKKVVEVSQATSNALALVNRIGS